MSIEELVQLIKQGTDPAGNMEQLCIQNKGMIFAVVKKYRYACQADLYGWGRDERHLTECRVAFLLLYIELRYIMEKCGRSIFILEKIDHPVKTIDIYI